MSNDSNKDDYVRAVSGLAKQTIATSLYPGDIFESLAAFLNRSSLKDNEENVTQVVVPNVPGNRGSSFVTYFRLVATEDLTCRRIHDPDHFDVDNLCHQKHLSTGLVEVCPALVFMNGYPSPQWLATVGSTCTLNPSFFQRHFNFRSPGRRRDCFSSPSLPSAANTITRLHLITIGSRSVKEETPNLSEVERLRSRVSKEMNHYSRILNTGNGIKLGDSVVRLCNVHDEQHFSIEQDISICVQRVSSTWIALIWSDFGNDLDAGPNGPWKSLELHGPQWRSSFYPTIQHLPDLARKWEYLMMHPDMRSRGRYLQSGSLLSRNYGKTLDQGLMKNNAFYALHELFLFSANSICQFLNMIDEKLSAEAEHQTMEIRQYSLSNLFHYQDILDRQIMQLRETIRIIKARGDSTWPRSVVKADVDIVEAFAESLLEDYEELHHRAQTLSARCKGSMAMVMNHAAISESKRAISQAKKVQQLTFLAFFYVPISFTTSFFGMNLGKIGEGRLALWVWFVVSVPLTLVSYGLLSLLTALA